MNEENSNPTRYSIVTRNLKGKVVICTMWLPFVSYEECNKERITIRDRRPTHEVNIEYSWQD